MLRAFSHLVIYSLCQTERDGQAGQSEAYQQHAQEEEVGARSAERTRGWAAVGHQRDLKERMERHTSHFDPS